MPIIIPNDEDPNAAAVSRCWQLLDEPGHITRDELREALAGTR